MKITYLGTAAAEGIPALFCQCEYCQAVKKRGGREIRSRSQVLFDGELCIDFPPDSFYHGALYSVNFSALKYLIATHAHMDHFYAQDFILRGYKYASALNSPLHIYGNEECAEVFAEGIRREMRPEVEGNVQFHMVGVFEEFFCGEWKINTLKAKHSSQNPLIFSIEKEGKRVLHLCDTGLVLEENYGYLQKISQKPYDLVTLDCTFLYHRSSESARHMGLYENAEVLNRLLSLSLIDENTKRVVTHFSHNSAPTPELLQRAEKEFGVICAYDGMTVEI